MQTHKFVRAIWIQDDKFSAQALHDFFGCIMVRVSVCVQCLFGCSFMRLECMDCVSKVAMALVTYSITSESSGVCAYECVRVCMSCINCMCT